MAKRHVGLFTFFRFIRIAPIRFTILALLLVATEAMAQPQAPAQGPTQEPAQSEQNVPAPAAALPESAAQPDAPITVPAQTQFALVLTHPIDSKSMHRGDDIYAQTTAPVAVGDQVVIPAGTFVQGQIDKLSRKGSRSEIALQSFSVLFPNGYVANVKGPENIESDEGTAWNNPSGGAKAGAFIAPMAGAGIGAAIGSAAHTTQSSTLGGTTITSSSPKGVAIGSVAGLAAGAVAMVVLLTHSHSFYVQLGSPMTMTLQQPMTLAANQVADALRQAQLQPPPPPPIAPQPQPAPPVNHGICYTPTIPGTPPTVIPGTPPIGNLPGTPSIVIPGTPSIPGSPYPCP